MRSIETSGKTVEDAIKTGLQELRLDSTEVTIDVLDMGSPGLFGMFGRLAKVRLTVKEKVDTFDFEMPIMSLDEQVPKRQEKKKPEPAPRREEAPAKPAPVKAAPKAEPSAPVSAPVKPAPKPAPKREEAAPVSAVQNKREEAPAPSNQRETPARQSAEREQGHNRPQNKRNDAQTSRRTDSRKSMPSNGEMQTRVPKSPKQEAFAPVDLKDLPVRDMATFAEEEKKAYDFLSNLTKLMGVNVEVRMQMNDGQLTVQLIGDTLGILIGRRGETLDALQYLTSLQVNKGREEYLRVSLDTEHYRAKREEALQKLASRMASRVRKTGHRVALEPMNPYERRVLHSALQNHPYVSTHSEGEEPYRRVIITLK